MTVASQAVALALVALCAVAVLGLAVWGLSKVPRLVRGWRYDWARAKHLTGLPVVEEVPGRDFYGSMSLADEPAWLPAPVAHEEDWLAQTRADLAPEALDSGPGETPSVDPGPDPDDDEPLSPPPLSHPVWRNPKITPADLPDDERLADTGDILGAHLAADVAAYQRAQDDQVRAWCSGWERERREFTRQLAEAWA